MVPVQQPLHSANTSKFSVKGEAFETAIKNEECHGSPAVKDEHLDKIAMCEALGAKLLKEFYQNLSLMRQAIEAEELESEKLLNSPTPPETQTGVTLVESRVNQTTRVDPAKGYRYPMLNERLPFQPGERGEEELKKKSKFQLKLSDMKAKYLESSNSKNVLKRSISFPNPSP